MRISDWSSDVCSSDLDAVALHALVAAYAALQEVGDPVLGNARAVVVDGQHQPRPSVVLLLGGTGGQQHARLRPLERVLEQVAEQFLQVARLAVELHARVDVKFSEDRKNTLLNSRP